MNKVALFGDSITNGRIGISYTQFLDFEYDSYAKDGLTINSIFKIIERTPIDENQIVLIQGGGNDLLIPHMANLSSVWAKSSKYMLQGENYPLEDEKQFLEFVEQSLSKIKNKILFCSLPILGENLHSSLNQKRKLRNNNLKSLVSSFENIKWCDITSNLEQISSESDYLLETPAQMAQDALKADQVKDALSSKRALKVTIDGVHLNTLGAKSVANVINSAFNQLSLHE
ncbi:MAG: SGNH/GDSL hydrolase family protein [Sphaerochaetaceae bacterium]